MNSRRSVVVGAGVTGTSAALTLAAQGVEDARYFPNEQTTLSTLAQSIAVDKLHLWQQQLLKEQRNAEHPLNIKLWLEKLLLQYSQLF